MIRCTNLHFSIRKKALIKNVSWQFKHNHISAIIGPNGAGKSTLLKLILGIMKPDHGQVLLGNREIKHWSLEDLAITRAYMAQKSLTPVRMPVFEYLSLARIQRQESLQQRDSWVNHVIGLLELGVLAKKSIDTLSGGELQRVELARAWCQLIGPNQVENTLLLLDEPTSALDIHQTEKLYQNLQLFVSQGGSVIIVEHDINQAARYCDQILLLKDGQCVEAGHTQQVFTAKNLNHCFDVNGSLVRHPQHTAMTFSL